MRMIYSWNVWRNLPDKPEQKAEGTQATVIKDETGCYVRVNRIWYQCKSKGEVLLYDGKIQLTKEKLEAKGASIYVIAAADGYLPTNWTYHFQGLEAPGVTLESGKNITTEVSEDDTIIAFTHEKSSETGISFQYYLTDRSWMRCGKSCGRTGMETRWILAETNTCMSE